MIIKSLLDTDLYKLTMQQVAFLYYPSASATFKFINRNLSVKLGPFAKEIDQEISNLCQLKFFPAEINYLRSLNLFTESYLNFLKDFQLSRDQITVTQDQNENLQIIAQGPWHQSIMFEVFVLSIVNEVYFRNTQPHPNYNLGRENLINKIALIKENNKTHLPFKLADFGTRRRFSSAWQGQVVQTLMAELGDSFLGTSSVYWAYLLGTKPIGTMAHEYFQAHQVLASSLRNCQTEALQVWLQAYQGKLAIALSDIFGTEPFLKDLDYNLSNQYQGLRHDSGDPFWWGEKVLNHYRNLQIDPHTKTLVFSDGLNIPKALKIHNAFANQVNVVFGIGTNLTNDFDFPALNIVMKMVYCNHQPVAKISDEPGKAICEDPEFLKLVKQTFGII